MTEQEWAYHATRAILAAHLDRNPTARRLVGTDAQFRAAVATGVGVLRVVAAALDGRMSRQQAEDVIRDALAALISDEQIEAQQRQERAADFHRGGPGQHPGPYYFRPASPGGSSPTGRIHP